jgi:uncharacterized DUF497 family protein
VKIRWDPKKAEANWRKHAVRFEEATTVFDDFNAIYEPDAIHSVEEDRYHAVGGSAAARILTVTYAIRKDDFWIISARTADRREMKRYMKHDELRDRPVAQDRDEKINYEDIPPQEMKHAVRGLHTRPRTVVTTVGLYEDVAQYFPDETAVNRALREVIAVGNAPSQRGY